MIKKNNDLNMLDEYKKFLKACNNGKRTKPNGTRILKDSVRKLEITYKLLYNFSELKQFPLIIKLHKKTNAGDVSKQKLYWQKFYHKFLDYLYDDLDCYDNYVGSVIKDLKTFFNYLIKEKNLSIGNYHTKFYIYKEDIEVITLLPEQLNYLINSTEFESRLSKTLLRVKDLFVIGCTVALRYSDLIRLTTANLEMQNDRYYLKIQSKKTRTYTRIKIPPYAVQILTKYKNKKNKLLPFYNLVGLNNHLKHLIEIAGWTEEKVKTRQKRGIATVVFKDAEKKIHFRFCDHMSSHTMRRTAITTMLRLRMPENLVRKISGHAPSSEEFHKYVSIAQDYLDVETDKVFFKLNTF